MSMHTHEWKEKRCAGETGLRPHRFCGLQEGRKRATPGKPGVGTGGATDRGTQQLGAVVTGVSCCFCLAALILTLHCISIGVIIVIFFPLFFPFLYSLSSFLSPFSASAEAPHRLVQLRDRGGTELCCAGEAGSCTVVLAHSESILLSAVLS